MCLDFQGTGEFQSIIMFIDVVQSEVVSCNP